MPKRDGRDPSPIPIPGAGTCGKCGEQMQRFEHSTGWKPLSGRGYFKYWDRCKCGFNRNPPDAYVQGYRSMGTTLP